MVPMPLSQERLVVPCVVVTNLMQCYRQISDRSRTGRLTLTTYTALNVVHEVECLNFVPHITLSN